MKLKQFIQQETVLTAAAVLAVVSAFFVPPDAQYLGYIDLRTLAILFSLMTVMAGLRRQGFLMDWAGHCCPVPTAPFSWRWYWSGCAFSEACSSPTMFPC